MVSDLELGWLAGIMDGEGSIRISKAIPKANPRISAQYSVEAHAATNTDAEIIEKVKEILTDLDIPFRVYGVRLDSRKDFKPYWKPAYTVRVWTVAGIRKYLSIIFPYLYGTKKEKASIVLQFIEIPRKKSYGRGSRPDTLTQKYEELYMSQTFRSGSKPDRIKNGLQKKN